MFASERRLFMEVVLDAMEFFRVMRRIISGWRFASRFRVRFEAGGECSEVPSASGATVEEDSRDDEWDDDGTLLLLELRIDGGRLPGSVGWRCRPPGFGSGFSDPAVRGRVWCMYLDSGRGEESGKYGMRGTSEIRRMAAEWAMGVGGVPSSMAAGGDGIVRGSLSSYPSLRRGELDLISVNGGKRRDSRLRLGSRE